MLGDHNPRFLDDDVILAINATFFENGRHCLSAADLLSSAVVAPQWVWQYEEGSDIFDLAASYCFHLAMNHPFNDGNKRTGLSTAIHFLEVNGLAFPTSLDAKYNEQLAAAVVALVSGEINQAEFAKILFITLRPLLAEEVQAYFTDTFDRRSFDTIEEAKAYLHDHIFCAIIRSLMSTCETQWINPKRFEATEGLVKALIQSEMPAEYHSQFGVESETNNHFA